MRYSIIRVGESRSFPEGDSFLAGGTEGPDCDITVCIGNVAEMDLAGVLQGAAGCKAVLLELGSECLGVHVGEANENPPANVLGFARYRTGTSKPSQLVELVRLPGTSKQAEADATAFLAEAGFEVAVCSDQAGRIIDRLVRPKYNAALRLVDEGLASAEAMDLTCRLGLGYAEGPVERVVAGGLADHYRVCRELFGTYGTAAYAPARSAVVAAKRAERG